MATTVADYNNWYRLDLLIHRFNKILRELFKDRVFLYFGHRWNDTSSDGLQYYSHVIYGNESKYNLTRIQKRSVEAGDSNQWDLTLSITLLLNTDRPVRQRRLLEQRLNKEDEYLSDVRTIRNRLVHHPTKIIDDNEFGQLWERVKSILVYFGENSTELDKFKDDVKQNTAIAEVIDSENVAEAKRLKDLGDKAFSEKRFTVAIRYFNQAVVLPNISAHDRAELYSDQAASRLSLYEQKQEQKAVEFSASSDDGDNDERYCALQDAKQARQLWPEWWKAHYCVGKTYLSLNEYEKASNSFVRALARDGSLNSEIKQYLDCCRSTLARQKEHAHLDPRAKPQTVEESLKENQEIYGLDPTHVRQGELIYQKFVDPSDADVRRGRQYLCGDVGIKQDYAQAVLYYTKAANKENAEGLYNLGIMYQNGWSVKQDHQMAVKLFERAASKPVKNPFFPQFTNTGVVEAEHALGLAYEDGLGVIKKDELQALQWYRRATRHGSATAANNLAKMYIEGRGGLKQDIDKAEELLKFAARKRDPNAMWTLAQLFYNKNDVQMSRLWLQTACDSDNMQAKLQREQFMQDLDTKQAYLEQQTPSVSHNLNKAVKMSELLNLKTSTGKASSLLKYNYDELNGFASRGSVTAQLLCKALEHFNNVISIVTKLQMMALADEQRVIEELANCYRTQQIYVVHIPPSFTKKFETIITRAFQAEDTESTRLCYVYFDVHDLTTTCEFLQQCKKKYPDSIHFCFLSASVNAHLEKFQESLFDCNRGLAMNSGNCELLYMKAKALMFLKHSNPDDAIEAFEKFLGIAPKDHRSVADCYYNIAQLHLFKAQESNKASETDFQQLQQILRKYYEQGLAAEIDQLPCFMPYDSRGKTYIEYWLDFKYAGTPETAANLPPPTAPPSTAAIRQNYIHLTAPHRTQLFKEHRQLISNSTFPLAALEISHTARKKQEKPKSLINLKSITLKEMNPLKDHVYDGYVLSVTIIDQPTYVKPAIRFLIEDENLDIERLFICDFPRGDGQDLISKKFTIGTKITLLNPYLEISQSDRKSGLRIDDYMSIVMIQNESEKLTHMCRACGEPNSAKRCVGCHLACYCSKRCQEIDWKFYKHKWVCEGPVRS